MHREWHGFLRGFMWFCHLHYNTDMEWRCHAARGIDTYDQYSGCVTTNAKIKKSKPLLSKILGVFFACLACALGYHCLWVLLRRNRCGA